MQKTLDCEHESRLLKPPWTAPALARNGIFFPVLKPTVRAAPVPVAVAAPERPGLDQRDAGPAAEVRGPVNGLIRRHRPYSPLEKLRWNADAVGSDWPWYLDPSSGEPYGRSTGLDIRKKLICPIRIPA